MMLDDVMNLARLQAGQEQLETRRFDAAQLLQELCEELQEQANQRGLYLKWGGPDADRGRRSGQDATHRTESVDQRARYTRIGGGRSLGRQQR